MIDNDLTNNKHSFFFCIFGTVFFFRFAFYLKKMNTEKLKYKTVISNQNKQRMKSKKTVRKKTGFVQYIN